MAEPRNAAVASPVGRAKLPEAFPIAADFRPYLVPYETSAKVIEYFVAAASCETPAEKFAPTIRPIFPASLMFPGKAVTKVSFFGLFQSVGATPESHAVKLPEVPDLSARKITLTFGFGSV